MLIVGKLGREHAAGFLVLLLQLFSRSDSFQSKFKNIKIFKNTKSSVKRSNTIVFVGYSLNTKQPSNSLK